MNVNFPIRDNPLMTELIPYEATVSLGEELRATWGHDQISSRMADQVSIWNHRASDAEVLEVPELKRKYGKLIDFDRPMTEGEAGLLYRNKRSELIRQNILARGDSGFWGGAAKLGVGFLDVATDPVELAIGIGTAALFPASGGTLGARVGTAFGEAFFASAISEVGYYSLSEAQQLDYSMGEALLNIGFGTLLGGSIGSAIAPRARHFTPTSREADLSRIAINQFVNDDPINFSPMARDMRAATSLTTVRGVDFQPAYASDLMGAEYAQPITIPLLDAAGAPVEYRGAIQAEVEANRLGLTVSRTPDGNFNLQQPIEGMFVRDAYGEPVRFSSLEDAHRFIASASRDEGLLPQDPRLVNFSGDSSDPTYGIAGGLSPDSISRIESGGSGVVIPRGVDTTQIELGPNPNNQMSKAMGGVGNKKGHQAYREVGKGYSAPRLGPSSTALDANIGTWSDPELAQAAEAFEDYKNVVGETLAEEDEITKTTATKIRGIESTVNCMLGGKT